MHFVQVATPSIQAGLPALMPAPPSPASLDTILPHLLVWLAAQFMLIVPLAMPEQFVLPAITSIMLVEELVFHVPAIVKFV